MRNDYIVEAGVVKIQVYHRKVCYLALVDEADLPLLEAIHCRWYANPARAPKGKFYVQAKQWDRQPGMSRTLLMHRVIMGHPATEVHHTNNDGLNNRRGNLWVVTHQENMRERWPEKNWIIRDFESQERAERVAVFKALVAIGNDVAQEFDLTRQAMWQIRNGHTRKSRAAIEYWRRVREAMPEIFGGVLLPWIAARKFTMPKPEPKAAENLRSKNISRSQDGGTSGTTGTR